MTKRWTLFLIAAALLIVSGMEADAQDTNPSDRVVFWSSQGPMAVERPAGITAHEAGPPDPQRLIEKLLRGPTPQEERDGLWTAIPSGTTVASVLQPVGETVLVRLEIPAPELERIDHEAFEVVVRQIGATLRPLAWSDLRIQVRDPASGDYVALAEFLPEIEVPVKPSSAGEGELKPPAPKGGQPPAPGQGQPNGSLSGKTVYVSAGHGWEWNSYKDQWRTQRPPYPSTGYSGPIVEDHNNAEAVNQYLLHYLWNAGAQVWPVRERNMNAAEAIVDDGGAGYSETGSGWSSAPDGYGGDGRQAATVTGDPTATARWETSLPHDGRYAVYVWYECQDGCTSDARYTVRHAGGDTTVTLDQRHHGYTWRYIGTYGFRAGGAARVTLTNQSSTGAAKVVADAVRFGGGMFNSLSGIDTIADNPPYRPWWEAASYYYTQRMGMAAGYGDVTVRPVYARWEHRGTNEDAVYVSWHSNGATGYAQWDYSGTETYVHNGTGLDRTPGSINLRDAIHWEVVHDIRAGWDPGWVDRGRKQANFGELRLLWDDDPATQMPGALIEIGFHDHPGDTDALKDPRFNQLVARALYQGIAKYFNPGACLLPEPPTHLALENIGGGSVRISWRPSPTDGVGLRGHAATGYRVYTSSDGIGWSNGVPVGGTEHLLSGLSTGELLFVRVTATNAGGESFPTETLAVRVGTTAELLLVNGFDRINNTMAVYESETVEGPNMRMLLDKMNRYDYVIQHGEAIEEATEHAFDSASNEAVKSGAVNLNDYAVVDWILGEESVHDETLDAAERGLLQAFLSSGGALFISGSEIGYHLAYADPGFYSGALRAGYDGDDARTYAVYGTSSDFAGLTFRFDAPGMYDADWPDQIRPANGSETALLYSGGAGGTAAVQYENPYDACERLVYFGFPFETIRPGQRSTVMSAVMGFLDECVDLAVQIDTAIDAPAYGTAHNVPPTFAGTAQAQNAPLTRVEVSVRRVSTGEYWNGAGWVAGETWLTAAGTDTWSYALPPLGSDGDYHLRARAWAENTDDPSPAEVTFTYDATPPEPTTLIAPVGGVEIAALPELLLEWTDVGPDGGSDITYRVELNEQSFATSSSSYATHVGQGFHEWRVRAEDAADNVSDWTPWETFTVRRLNTWLPVTLLGRDGPPPVCQDLIVNGGFESGLGWEANNAEYDTTQSHSGQRSALVGYDAQSFSSVRQQVTLPEGVRATLRLWVYPINENNDPDDLQYVWLWDQDLGHHPLELTTSDARIWRQGEYDLSEFAGQRVTVIIGATNDGDGNVTRVYVDDVELEICP